MKKITPQEMRKLNQNFIDTRSAAIEAAIGKPDNLSTWFPIEQLKEYIAEVEAEGIKKGNPVTGLRVYLGAYSKNNPDPAKKNYTTVFFSPTTSASGSGDAKMMAVSAGEDPDEGGTDGANEGGTGHPPSAPYPQ